MNNSSQQVVLVTGVCVRWTVPNDPRCQRRGVVREQYLRGDDRARRVGDAAGGAAGLILATATATAGEVQ
jgi:hypothetical protein